MKKLCSLLSIILIASITAVHANAFKSNSSAVSSAPIAASISADIHKILQNDCMGCHSKGGAWMAECYLNFSKWDNYKPEKQAKKASKMVKMLKKEAMPPKKFRQSHPASISTEAEISMISKWADSLKK